ncbi:NAD(P)H-hydrate dehydratase [Cereibacter azotoformans]|uniref:NAD(P)H-hydrate dehydratase n=1 Tax=Cereibacter azotoformans TaxID=43057 RepID=UPI000C6E3826|nr:NAD(P)H-hydrate dehydratase [Cereibacter azotoformans]
MIRAVCAPDPQRLAKHEGQHKYDHGHALVLSGPPGHGGAARLAARAALRVGAGLVTLGCPRAAVGENAARLDAVMLRAVDAAEDLERLLEDRRLNAICLGPGLGLEPVRAELVAATLASGRPAVLDADALTLLARDPCLAARLHSACVLTPHGGEFQRLFPDLASVPRPDAVAAAATRSGCVVLLKGAETRIAGPDGLALHAATGAASAPWLATAGAGDVLAGLIAGLLARGLPPQEAAETGVWLHAEAARRVGPGLIAEDLPEALPAVFRSLGL